MSENRYIANSAQHGHLHWYAYVYDTFLGLMTRWCNHKHQTGEAAQRCAEGMVRHLTEPQFVSTSNPSEYNVTLDDKLIGTVVKVDGRWRILGVHSLSFETRRSAANRLVRTANRPVTNGGSR